MENPIIFLTACEPSGDRLGAAIINALREKLPQAQFIGVAGPLMRAAGCEVIMPQEQLAVMGFVEVLKQLPRLLKARNFVAEKALALRPAIYLGIDAPDFNLTVEEKLKAAGIKTVHLNSPTIWAWRSGRIKKIKRAVDLMLTLFPFETNIYQQNQIAVKFIGHPLADEIPLQAQKQQARAELSIAANAKVLALMPGSRASELKYLTPVFLAAAKICQQQIPDLQIVAPMINEKRATQFKAMLQSQQPQLNIHISIGNAHQILQASDAVLIASGTATLEAMLCKTPMVVAYKADALSFWLARKLVKIPHVSLPNILAGKALVPELLQEQATPEKLAEACAQALTTNSNTDLFMRFSDLHQALQQNAAKQAADAIAELINR